jgi:FkbM family methyltransferase
MPVKSLFKRALHTLGFDVIRYVPGIEHSFPVLPYVVRARMHPNFLFIQVGANDGVHGDPIRDLVLEHDLSGILVEPLPDLFAHLRQNYAGRVKLRFENAAIGAEEGVAPIYRVCPDTPGAPRWWFDLASFDRDVLMRHGIPAGVIETLMVPTTTFKALLARHGVSRMDVDLLQVDTEGYDGAVVRAALASGLRPGIINYESCHLPPRERYELRQLLKASHYHFIDIDRDTLAVKFDPAPRSS